MNDLSMLEAETVYDKIMDNIGSELYIENSDKYIIYKGRHENFFKENLKDIFTEHNINTIFNYIKLRAVESSDGKIAVFSKVKLIYDFDIMEKLLDSSGDKILRKAFVVFLLNRFIGNLDSDRNYQIEEILNKFRNVLHDIFIQDVVNSLLLAEKTSFYNKHITSIIVEMEKKLQLIDKKTEELPSIYNEKISNLESLRSVYEQKLNDKSSESPFENAYG